MRSQWHSDKTSARDSACRFENQSARERARHSQCSLAQCSLAQRQRERASFRLKQRQLTAAGTAAGREGLDFTVLSWGSGRNGLHSGTSHTLRASLRKALPSTKQPQEENPPGQGCVPSGLLSHAPACRTQGPRDTFSATLRGTISGQTMKSPKGQGAPHQTRREHSEGAV